MDHHTTPEPGDTRHSHPTRRPRERAFLVGAELAGVAQRFSVEDSLAELALLAITAGFDVVGQTTQKLCHPLLERVDAMPTRQMTEVTALIPYSRGDLVALWRQHGVIAEEDHLAEGTRVVGRLPEALVAQVEPFRAARVRPRAGGGHAGCRRTIAERGQPACRR